MTTIDTVNAPQPLDLAAVQPIPFDPQGGGVPGAPDAATVGPVLQDVADQVDVYGPADLVSQIANSSNYNEAGNFNPLSPADEARLRDDRHDFAAMTPAELDSAYDDYVRIGALDETRSEAVQAGLVGLLRTGIDEFKGAIPLPEVFKSNNGILDRVTDDLFGAAKDKTFGWLEDAVDRRTAELSVNPEVAFTEIDKAIAAFNEDNQTIGRAIDESQRILQSRRDGHELSDDDREALADARKTFQAYYGSDFQSGTASIERDALRQVYYEQHWRVVNYTASQEKLTQVEAQQFRNDAMAIGGPDLDNPSLSQDTYSEFHYNRRAAEGAEQSADVWRDRYTSALDASDVSHQALHNADENYWNKMGEARAVWDEITAELDG